jgi:hypothetical protein
MQHMFITHVTTDTWAHVQADINVAADEFEEQLKASRAKLEVGDPLAGALVLNEGSVFVPLSAWLHL